MSRALARIQSTCPPSTSFKLTTLGVFQHHPFALWEELGKKGTSTGLLVVFLSPDTTVFANGSRTLRERFANILFVQASTANERFANGSRTGPFANAGPRGTSTTNERRTVRERFANGANERFRAPRSKPFHASRFMQAVSCSLGGREECPEPLGQPNNSLIRAHDGAAVLGVTGTPRGTREDPIYVSAFD